MNPESITRRVTAALGAIWIAMAAVPSAAQNAPWKPERPVALVVPYSAGGGTDANARAVAQQLSRVWGQPVTVENMPGADGLIGTRRVIEARPDGYTLLMQVQSIVLTKYMPGVQGVDPLERLEPITSVAQSPGMAVISAKVPARTLAEFIHYCKVSVKPCSLASGETTSRLMARQLAEEAGLPNLIVANYRGNSAFINDMISNAVDMSFMGISASLPYHKAGTLRAIATLDVKRATALPDVPTSAEAGFPQFRIVTWFGLFAPKGTPPAVIQGIVAAVREAVKEPAVKSAFAAAGAEPVANTTAEFAAQVRAESDRFGALAKRYPIE
ncbi:MAG TPA: tripartite tricarboxylate transporter substrate binding protein [Ramlibacter sp.]|uniref:Bug family tripartite tricarboxylate transporter substrate binding protein n=1 Tax=Ramlibacter sp. TaxID=1917967 RepID=UPI002CF4837A|nr:tripartite tricarboxylate transporter substrate binding protein [Ramlibacter sp.]HVZ42194.1 tripartite tricarboxylate transporter substrate binding protein [Ramlibacter sp.]